MRTVLCAILCGTFAFLVLTRRNVADVHAAGVTPVGRFELVQLHPNASSEWSGVLDTQTGCTWVFTANNPDDPEIKNQDYKLFLEVLGAHSFDLVNFDTSDYIPLQ